MNRLGNPALLCEDMASLKGEMTERTSSSTKCSLFDKGKTVITTKTQGCLKKLNRRTAMLPLLQSFKAHFGQHCTQQVVIALGVSS